MKYRSVLVTKRGGPESLQVVENELRSPKAGEVRIKVLATGVGRTDINYRYGLSPFSPKVPFVPGYEIMGTVEAVISAHSGRIPRVSGRIRRPVNNIVTGQNQNADAASQAQVTGISIVVLASRSVTV